MKLTSFFRVFLWGRGMGYLCLTTIKHTDMQPSRIKLRSAKEVHEDYDAFVDKFKPKRTTDDCITPPEVYEAVLEWLRDEGVIGADTPIVRPFWPGGDYEKENYAEGCCVVDNPPFSIMARILRHYVERDVRFFLFGPSLTLFSGSGIEDVTYVVTNSDITYANGARVRTGFITNLPAFSHWAVMTSPELAQRIDEAMDKGKAAVPSLPKYVYPYHVVTSAGIQKVAKHVGIRIPRSECVRIRRMDAQIPLKKGVFGSGFLCSDRVAAEMEAAELKYAELRAEERRMAEQRKAAEAVVVPLSERERLIVEELGLHG